MQETKNDEERNAAELAKIKRMLNGKKLVAEFAEWLVKEDVDPSTVETLLCTEWDGAYPSALLGDDLRANIDDFLYRMGEFAVSKIFGAEYRYQTRPLDINILPVPDYESASYLYIVEMETRTVLVRQCVGKTWNFNPENLEAELDELVNRLEESKSLLAIRVLMSDKKQK